MGRGLLHAALGHLDVLADGLLLEREFGARGRRLEAEHFRLEGLRQGREDEPAADHAQGQDPARDHLPRVTAELARPYEIHLDVGDFPHLVPEAREDGRHPGAHRCVAPPACGASSAAAEEQLCGLCVAWRREPKLSYRSAARGVRNSTQLPKRSLQQPLVLALADFVEAWTKVMNADRFDIA